MLIANQQLEVADHSVFLPTTSFSVGGPSVEQIAALGFLPVTVWKPYDHATQKLVSAAPYRVGDEVFTVEVADKTAEELAADAQVKAAQVRVQRNALLAGSDWTQLADAPVDKAEWATYRQALRDVTAQVAFPNQVEWPVAP